MTICNTVQVSLLNKSRTFRFPWTSFSFNISFSTITWLFHIHFSTYSSSLRWLFTYIIGKFFFIHTPIDSREATLEVIYSSWSSSLLKRNSPLSHSNLFLQQLFQIKSIFRVLNGNFFLFNPFTSSRNSTISKLKDKNNHKKSQEEYC